MTTLDTLSNPQPTTAVPPAAQPVEIQASSAHRKDLVNLVARRGGDTLLAATVNPNNAGKVFQFSKQAHVDPVDVQNAILTWQTSAAGAAA